MPSRTGEQLVGFAAAVLPRPAGRGTWRCVRFYFGEELGSLEEESDSGEDSEDPADE